MIASICLVFSSKSWANSLCAAAKVVGVSGRCSVGREDGSVGSFWWALVVLLVGTAPFEGCVWCWFWEVGKGGGRGEAEW